MAQKVGSDLQRFEGAVYCAGKPGLIAEERERMTKREALKPASLLVMFEEILQKQGLFHDSDDWRERKYSYHAKWVKPMLTAGHIREIGKSLAWPDGVPADCDRPQFHYHKFEVTPSGIDWWLHQYADQVTDCNAYARLIDPRVGDGHANLDGKGVGAHLTYYFFWGDGPIAARGVLDGYFEFVSFYHYYRDLTGARITVSLTERGMRFFDSLPRLVLECA